MDFQRYVSRTSTSLVLAVSLAGCGGGSVSGKTALSLGDLIPGLSFRVSSVQRQTPVAALTPMASVVFEAEFNDDALGVDAGDFTITSTGTLAGTSVASVVAVSPSVYRITVNSGTGDGTLRLDLVDNGSIKDLDGTALTGSFNSGQTYTLDRTAPSIVSIVRKAGIANPSALAEVVFTATFSEAVSGVTAADFLQSASGLAGTTIVSISQASATVFEVRVSTGTGGGTLGLDLADDDSVTDLAGNALGGAGAQNHPGDELFTLDRSAPIITFTSQPPAITNATTGSAAFTVSDAGTSVSLVECRLDSAAFASCTTPFSAPGLAEGNHSIEVRATDAAGNVSTGTVSWLVDVTAPAVTIGSAPASPSSDTTPDFAFSATDTLSSVAGYECRFDAASYAACTSPLTSAALAHGAHGFDVRATDSAGNVSAPVHHSWNVDTAFPTISSVTRKSGAQNPTAAATVLFTVTFSEAVSGVDAADFGLSVSGVAGTSVSSVTPVSGSVYEVAASTGTGSGTIRLDVSDDGSIADAAANALGGPGAQNHSTGESFTIDRTGPVISFTAQPPSFSATAADAASFTVTDATSSVATTECRVDTGAFASCTSPFNATGLAEGNHAIEVRAADSLGNSSTGSVGWLIDLTAPSISLTLTPPALDTEPRPTFGFSGTDALSGLASYECSLDSSAYFACVSPLVTPTLRNGAHIIDVRAIDAAGNASATPAHHAWTIDNTPPDGFLISGITGGSDSVQDGVLSGGTAATAHWADTAGEDSYEATIFEANGTTVKCATETVAAGVTQKAFASCSLTIGASYVLVVIAKDTIGNQRMATNAPFSFSVASGTPALLELAGPEAIASGSCTEFFAESRSADGLPAIVTSAKTVNLAANNSVGLFYSDAACLSTVTSASIAINQYRAGFYFRSAVSPESATLIATAAGLSPATKLLTVGNNPSRLLLSGPPQIATGRCTQFKVSQVDNLGNKVSTSSATTVELDQNGSLLFYPGNSCSSASISSVTIQANDDTAVFYVRNALVQAVNLEAEDSGAALSSDTYALDTALNLDWWNPSWHSRLRLTLNNLDQALAHANQPVLVRLDSSRVDYSKIQNAGQDLRFVAADQTTVLSHEVELWNESGVSYVWVNVPTIQASSMNNFLFLYYDNAAATDAQNRASTWTGYWGVWHLGEDPSGGAPQYLDSTMAGNKNGTASGGPLRAAGAVGYGVTVDGPSDQINTGFDLSAVLGRTSTFSIWLRTTQTGSDTNWLAPGITGIEVNGGTNDIFFGWIDAIGRICVTAGNGVGARSNFVVNDNAWRQVTITRDHASGLVQFFVNGVINGSGTSTTGAITTAFSSFGIIGDTGGTPEDYNGAMDEIRIFDSVQSPGKIRADYKFQVTTHIEYAAPEGP